MIKKFNNVFSFLWENRNKITFIIMIVMIILFWRQCGQAKYEKKKNYQNQKALTDTLTYLKQENGDLIVQKSTFISNSKDLKDLNSDLSKELDLLKKQKSKPKVVIKTKVVYVDKGSVQSNVFNYGNNKYSLGFDYMDSDSIFSIKGKTNFKAYTKIEDGEKGTLSLDIKPGKTVFDSIRFNIGLTLGVKEDKDGIDRVFAKPSPYTEKIKIEDIDAVQVEEFYKDKYSKKSKKFSVGPYVGIGAGTGLNGQVVIRPQVGVGIQWNLFKF